MRLGVASRRNSSSGPIPTMTSCMAAVTNYSPGDVLLADLPFSTGRKSKVRPCMVVLDVGDDDVVLARVTSQPVSTPFDILLSDWQLIGLLGPSTVRLHKLATVHKSLVIKPIGPLPRADRQAVAAVLHKMFANW